jgi:3-deoxy-D-manno-octulosonic-acid transferase
VSTRSEPPRDAAGFLLYDAVGLLVTAVGAPLLPLLRRTRHGRGIEERLGGVPRGARGLARPLWLHAASVGEVLSTEPLIRELRRHRPDLPIVVSTTSWTGRNTAAERLGADGVMLLPLDIRWVVRRCVKILRPRMLVIVETEIWPTLIREVARTGAPVALVSGRLTDSAVGRYRRIGWFLRGVLDRLSLFLMQTEQDAERIRAIGAPPERVRVLGSLKFARDTAAGPPRSSASRLALPSDRPVFVAASTQPGEEELVLDAFAELWKSEQRPLLVIAPRRPARFNEVAGIVAARGLAFERRSESGRRVAASTQVYVLDTLGELAEAFPSARAVFVGGTTGTVGGHNVLEPAVFAKPVSFGPDTSNVEVTAQALLAAGGATRIADAAGLAAIWMRLLEDAGLAATMGRAAREVVDLHSAVAERTAAALLPFLDRNDVDAEPDHS